MELAEILREFMSSSRGSMQMTGRIWPESLFLNAPTLQHGHLQTTYWKKSQIDWS